MIGRRYLICDIEATGLDENREIIEIALITYQDGQVTEIFETLINPLRSVPEHISRLTSISNRELLSAPKFYDIADSIRMRLEGAIFVSHKTEFDLELLKKKFHEMGQEMRIKSFCTLKVSQHEIPGLSNYNLEAICHFFGIKISNRHRAVGDALATLELFKELVKLRFKIQPKIIFLPHHEKCLNKIPAKSGLLYFKDNQGKVIRLESAFNMEKTARGLLIVKPENREILTRTVTIDAEVTGSALIAEFKKLRFHPFKPNWVILIKKSFLGEKNFTIRPYKRGIWGLWYFSNYSEAKKKLKELKLKTPTDKYAHREGGKSKEEILRHNQKIDLLSKDA